MVSGTSWPATSQHNDAGKDQNHHDSNFQHGRKEFELGKVSIRETVDGKDQDEVEGHAGRCGNGIGPICKNKSKDGAFSGERGMVRKPFTSTYMLC